MCIITVHVMRARYFFCFLFGHSLERYKIGHSLERYKQQTKTKQQTKPKYDELQPNIEPFYSVPTSGCVLLTTIIYPNSCKEYRVSPYAQWLQFERLFFTVSGASHFCLVLVDKHRTRLKFVLTNSSFWFAFRNVLAEAPLVFVCSRSLFKYFSD